MAVFDLCYQYAYFHDFLILLQGEGWISRKAAGLCFDFVPNDQTTYVTGTEEGSLHRCSVSYNEQYLDTYIGHQGPVHRVKFSPRWPNLFLSCSADWTIRLYHLRAKVSAFL
jgi:WD40 repeat protein